MPLSGPQFPILIRKGHKGFLSRPKDRSLSTHCCHSHDWLAGGSLGSGRRILQAEASLEQKSYDLQTPVEMQGGSLSLVTSGSVAENILGTCSGEGRRLGGELLPLPSLRHHWSRWAAAGGGAT